MIRAYLRRSQNGKHKFEIELPSKKIVRFGAVGYSNYTIHKNRDRMERYVERHRRGHEDWTKNGVATPGFWARWILWSEPTLENAIRVASKKSGYKILYIK